VWVNEYPILSCWASHKWNKVEITPLLKEI
jgi:hypothetical protein